jgi:hypothetical protein
MAHIKTFSLILVVKVLTEKSKETFVMVKKFKVLALTWTIEFLQVSLIMKVKLTFEVVTDLEVAENIFIT